MPADDKHVDPVEFQDAALDPAVGDGTPDTAPDCLHLDEEWQPPTSWTPTRKWMARTVVAVGGLATTVATTGSWDQEHTLFAITAVVAAVTSYLLPSD